MFISKKITLAVAVTATALLLPLTKLHAEEQDQDVGPQWQTIMTDDGEYGGWVRLSQHYQKLLKVLPLYSDPANIKKAIIEYTISVEPYDPKTKTHPKGEANKKFNWANLIIKVNDVIVLDEPANKYISKGVHKVNIPVKCLKEGDNKIEFYWKKLTGEDKKNLQYGYIYFASSKLDEPSETSFYSKDYGKTFLPLTLGKDQRESHIRLRVESK